MKNMIPSLLVLAAITTNANYAQAQFNRVAMDREYIISLTSQWKGERLADGRPYVSDNLLERLKKVVLHMPGVV